MVSWMAEFIFSEGLEGRTCEECAHTISHGYDPFFLIPRRRHRWRWSVPVEVECAGGGGVCRLPADVCVVLCRMAGMVSSMTEDGEWDPA